MRHSIFFIFLSILTTIYAFQVPFQLNLSPLAELQSAITENIPSALLAQLHLKWTELEQKFGKQFMIDNYEQFKLVHFSKDVQDYTYSIKTLDSYPSALGFDTVEQFTGYFQVEELEKQYFFWFFESRNDPKHDPLIVWLNGGPGCSDMAGLGMELGPSSINSTIQPDFNPYSWNSNASILFLDQPATVGFSRGGRIPFSTKQASVAFVNFIKAFYERFPRFSSLDLHIAGESYAGHYIPKFATSIVESGIKLKSIMIGNGITDPLVQWGERAAMGCGEGGIGQIYTDKECYEYPQLYQSFKPIGELCYRFKNPLICFLTTFFLPDSPSSGKLNPYDSRVMCNINATGCYPEIDYIIDYFNLPYVQTALGVPETEFALCNSNVSLNFIADIFYPYQDYVAELLDNDIPVLIYAGDKDLVCDWVGNHAWVSQLNYTNHEQFTKAQFVPWYTENGKWAGQVKNYKHFTFLRVFDSGHMVPTNQPANALDMVNRWVGGDYNFSK